MSALVQLTDVSKKYADTSALHSTNLSIERGKTTVLIGPSGCGKSTLLRLIIRLIEPDTGTIEFDGVPVTPDKIELVSPSVSAKGASAGLSADDAGLKLSSKADAQLTVGETLTIKTAEGASVDV